MRTTKLIKRMLLATALLLSTGSHAMKLVKQNLAELTNASDSIISGQVIKVTDGFDNQHRPYTEITIKVGIAAKGKHADESNYTFRQFGLIKPRSMGNGKVYLGVTPEGFAKWQQGEHVIAFLYKPASITGFQTTAGMAQGKFVISNGKVQNIFANDGLFENIDATGFTQEEQDLLTTPGAIKTSTFMGLVGKLAGVEE